MALPGIDKIFRWMSVDIYNTLNEFTPEQWRRNHEIWPHIPSKRPKYLVKYIIVTLRNHLNDADIAWEVFPAWCRYVNLSDSYARNSVNSSKYNYVPRSDSDIWEYVLTDPINDIYLILFKAIRAVLDQDLIHVMLYRGNVIPDHRLIYCGYVSPTRLKREISEHVQHRESVFVQALGHIALELNMPSLKKFIFKSQYTPLFESVMTPDQLIYIE